jgi:hypothetical protein
MFDAVASRNAFMRSPKIWPSTLQMAISQKRRRRPSAEASRHRPFGGPPDMQPCGVATSKLTSRSVARIPLTKGAGKR